MEIKTPPKIHAYAYHICRAWYNGSYTMSTKPINFLELHYTMPQFLIILDIHPRDAFRPIARERKYLMDCIFGGRGVGREGVGSVGIHSTGHNECRLLFFPANWVHAGDPHGTIHNTRVIK